MEVFYGNMKSGRVIRYDTQSEIADRIGCRIELVSRKISDKTSYKGYAFFARTESEVRELMQAEADRVAALPVVFKRGSPEFKRKMSLLSTGRVMPDEARAKISKSKLGIKRNWKPTKKHIQSLIESRTANARRVMNNEGTLYSSARDAANELGVRAQRVWYACRNNSWLCGFQWKYVD